MQEALGILEKASNSCVLQPTVAILCGDVNLDQDNANACCQPRNGDATPNVLNQWHTQTSSAAPNCSFFLGSFVLLHHAIEVKLVAARPNKHDLALEFSIAKKTKDQNKQPDNKLLWNIGGSTGGFTRAVLYNWTPPNLDDDLQ